jgi:hypothetical protein
LLDDPGVISIDLMDGVDRNALGEAADLISNLAEPRRYFDDAGAVARLFSAKEAAIKIISPSVRAFIDFRKLRAVETAGGFDVFADELGFAVSVHLFEVEQIIVSLGASRSQGA